MIKRGEIYWVNLNPIIGKETGKIRPCVVVSNDYNNEYAATLTLLPITSKTHKLYPFEVLIKAGEGGLKSDSKIKTNQIRTVDKTRVKEFIGFLSSTQMDDVKKALNIHLDLLA